MKHLKKATDGIWVPAGVLPDIISFAHENHLIVTLKDQQVVKPTVPFKSKLELKPEQQTVMKKHLAQDRAVLEAHPGFGKTMVALHYLTKRKQPTLIIVHTKALLHQWRKRIEDYLVLERGDLGIIGDNKWQLGKKITIASYQTLSRRGVSEIKDQFGLVIVDECHHVPARTLTKVLKYLPAKYVLGLTATPYRRDKLERLIQFYIGIVISTPKHTLKSKTNEAPSIPTHLLTQKTDFEINKRHQSEFNDITQHLTKDNDRNQLIVSDVVTALKSQAKCLILTERIEHVETLLKLVRSQIKGIQAATITGSITKKKREQLSKRVKQKQFQLLVATGKIIGEGFDWPELTHLFLAFPFSWKGKLVQYVGRVQRVSDGKEKAYVYDYIDYQIPMLRVMYFKRLRTYRSLGLEREKTTKSKRSKITAPESQLSLF